MSLQEKFQIIAKGWVAAKKEGFTNNPIANLLRKELKKEIENIVGQFDSNYEVEASAGAGNWANVPWVSILNPKITSTTQEGIYPVYLFKADGSGFYLSLNQGTTSPAKKWGKKVAEERAEYIKKQLLKKIPGLEYWGVKDINLKANTSLGKSYEKPSVIARYYSTDSVPSDEILKNDLYSLLKFYREIEGIELEMQDIPTKGKLSVADNSTIPLPKPFLLLAGISGTGKSRFVREQAVATGSREETYCLVSVRPDWHEPSDLLGYTTRLNNNAEYVTTDVLRFIVKAWKAIAETDVQIAGNKTAGHRDDLQAIPPYWLCLDEMNLAPVEQYFADYLSILETREWEWADDEFTYQCSPLLNASVISSLSPVKQNELCKNLGLDPTSALWIEFSKHGIGIPFNLLVAGTVNMDETTHGFSRKVIDRALSFDFGDFFPNDFDDYFSPTIIPKKLSYPIYSHAAKSQSRLPKIDVDGKKSIAFLQSLNTVLDNTPFKLAYRALNELLLSVISHQPEDEIQLQAVWDDFLMCKLLPRIEGDSDKLAQHDIDESLLIKLSRILSTTLHDIWNEPTGLSSARPDFYREKQQGGATIIIACRSRAKIEWMQNKLAQSGFTSFWP
ncbi:MrcB family domain-containing protein [Pectobacterium brasiliense]|uniref:MrcB family domain-containing protein n=1 Tax=Pectobacterium brasiliense TaxID=180957 RepID=UPI00406C3846